MVAAVQAMCAKMSRYWRGQFALGFIVIITLLGFYVCSYNKSNLEEKCEHDPKKRIVLSKSVMTDLKNGKRVLEAVLECTDCGKVTPRVYIYKLENNPGPQTVVEEVISHE